MSTDVLKVFSSPVPKVLGNHCPTCGAKPNEPCELTTGQLRNELHVDRRLAAKRNKNKVEPSELDLP